MPVSASIGASVYPLGEIMDYLKSRVENLTIVDSDRAAADLGSDRVLNVVLLGAAVRTGELGVTEEDVMEAIHQRLAEKFHALNEKALMYTADN